MKQFGEAHKVKTKTFIVINNYEKKEEKNWGGVGRRQGDVSLLRENRVECRKEEE